jgi:hypothetical protein
MLLEADVVYLLAAMAEAMFKDTLFVKNIGKYVIKHTPSV